MAFSEKKLIDLNVYYYIKDQVLFSIISDSISFHEEVEDDELESIEIVDFGIKATDHKAYKGTDRNWIYGQVSMPIVVKKNGFDIGSDDYYINYLNGVIMFTTAYAATLDDADLITASYTFLTVEVIDGYPYDRLKKPEFSDYLPTVAIEYMDGLSVPYELGGTEENLRSFSIHVLATSDSERDDISGIIANGLKYSIPVIDYREGMPLNYDGTLNADFQAVELDSGRIKFESVRDRTVRLENPMPNQRYWNILTFTARSFV